MMSSNEGQSSPLRILVADDNVDAADTLALLLRIDGHEVAVEYNGESALSRFLAMEPHVALLDIGLPDMTGHELARQIRRSRCGSEALLVAISGWGAARDKAASSAAGFNHHMVKPADFDVLRNWIHAKVPADT